MKTSFNPCFSGSCSRMKMSAKEAFRRERFNPCFSGSCSRMIHLEGQMAPRLDVSILVLVDLAHEQRLKALSLNGMVRFNPCFSGSCSRIPRQKSLPFERVGFNPCFSGSCSRILNHRQIQSEYFVSILVLVDLAHEYICPFCLACSANSFNPCFSGSCSRISQQTQ